MLTAVTLNCCLNLHLSTQLLAFAPQTGFLCSWYIPVDFFSMNMSKCLFNPCNPLVCSDTEFHSLTAYFVKNPRVFVVLNTLPSGSFIWFTRTHTLTNTHCPPPSALCTLLFLLMPEPVGTLVLSSLSTLCWFYSSALYAHSFLSHLKSLDLFNWSSCGSPSMCLITFIAFGIIIPCKFSLSLFVFSFSTTAEKWVDIFPQLHSIHGRPCSWWVIVSSESIFLFVTLHYVSPHI